MERWITKTEFARERDVTQPRVSQWLADGRIVEGAAGSEHEGLIEATAAHAALDAMLDQTKGVRSDGANVTSRSPEENTVSASSVGAAATGGPAPVPQSGATSAQPAAGGAGSAPAAGAPAAPTPYWDDKARREKAEANMAELKYQREAGMLVSVDVIRREQAALARALTSKMQALIDRVADVLDPKNPDRAHKLLTTEWQGVARELRIEAETRVAEEVARGEAAAVAT